MRKDDTGSRTARARTAPKQSGNQAIAKAGERKAGPAPKVPAGLRQPFLPPGPPMGPRRDKFGRFKS